MLTKQLKRTLFSMKRINSLSKKIIGLFRVWIEKTKEVAASKENEDDYDELPETTIGQRTTIDSSIVYDKPKSSSQKSTVNFSALLIEKSNFSHGYSRRSAGRKP